MQQWREIAEYVGFSDEDLTTLKGVWPVVEPEVTRIIERFYQRALSSPETRRILQEPAQVERLKRTMQIWLSELFLSDRDDGYVERRRRIGWRHVTVGLESRFMHTAMTVMVEDVQELLPAGAGSRALSRAAALDLALMTGGYVDSRERRSLESLQELLVTHLRTIVVLCDERDTVVAATRSTSQWLAGVPIVGRRWDEVLPAGLVAGGDLHALVRDAVGAGEPRGRPRIDVREGDLTRSYRVDVVPITHQSARLLMEVEELTEVVGLEGRLRRSEALAQLGALSAAVAHELRNPLAGISGAIQVISRTIPKDAPYHPIMAKVEREIRRLDALVTDLLAFARPGVVRLRFVDLREPVDAAVDWTRDDHPEVEVEVTGAGSAQADPDLVQQIVLNLLQNAIQAMDGDPGCERRQLRVDVTPGRVAVSDSGPGVPAELGERIFEPFTTTKTRGTGLGLAICTRSAVAMGGSLTLGQGPLRGASFVLSLGLAR